MYYEYHCGVLEVRKLRRVFALLGVTLVFLWTVAHTSRTAYHSWWLEDPSESSSFSSLSFSQRHLLSVNFSLGTATEIREARRGRENYVYTLESKYYFFVQFPNTSALYAGKTKPASICIIHTHVHPSLLL